MVQISPVGIRSITNSAETPQLKHASSDIRYVTTICYGRKGGVASKLIWAPWNITKWVASSIWSFFRGYVFCCFYDSSEIDWEATKEIFDTIYTAVFPAEHGNHPTDRQKAFKKEFDRLSVAAQERLKEHICLALAKRAGKKEGAEQEQWVKEHHSKIKFKRDYLDNIASNDIVKAAVKAFQAEIEDHTK
ncbi:MAG: hypothetical protein P0S96_03500 [Simkaniaceae bacterium]|nr:hypothetical protein [Candidatus Sacchlamyda saccharinae]